MKKVQYSYLPAEGSLPEVAGKNKTNLKMPVNKTGSNPPTEEMVAKLNAISREYPFCAYMKQKSTSLL